MSKSSYKQAIRENNIRLKGWDKIKNVEEVKVSPVNKIGTTHKYVDLYPYPLIPSVSQEQQPKRSRIVKIKLNIKLAESSNVI